MRLGQDVELVAYWDRSACQAIVLESGVLCDCCFLSVLVSSLERVHH